MTRSQAVKYLKDNLHKEVSRLRSSSRKRLSISFLEKANEDICVAKRLYKKYPDLAVFHLQQAVEKLAKAVFFIHELEGIEKIKRHSALEVLYLFSSYPYTRVN
jgi:HEPN domain-containing protein